MNIEITRLSTRTIENLSVAFGRGVVVFNPVTAMPTRSRNTVGSRRSAVNENRRARLDDRKPTRNDKRLHGRETIRTMRMR